MGNTKEEITQNEDREDNQEELIPAWVTTLSQTITQSVKEALQELKTENSQFPTLDQITQSVREMLKNESGGDQREVKTSPLSEEELEKTIKRVLESLQFQQTPEKETPTKRPFLYKVKKERSAGESQ